MSFKIQQFEIGPGRTPFIIAEMSGNHNGSFERAMQIVEAAAKAGAHALKLQTYTADTMTINASHGEFFISDPNSLWKGRTLYDLYRDAHTPWEWHAPIFRRCRELGLAGFSTPFDRSALEYLENLEVPCYKIASFENTDLELIGLAASTGKPLIVSTGMATFAEIEDIVTTARAAGCGDLMLLKCTSEYPADPGDSHLATIPVLREAFDVQVGLSDHTMGIAASIAAVALGAVSVERHFTLARGDGGVDSAFSLEPAELKALVQGVDTAARAIGRVMTGPTEKEQASLLFRRSLYVVEPVKAGEAFTEKNVRAIRPGRGLPVKYLKVIKGKRSNRDIAPGTPLSLDFLG